MAAENYATSFWSSYRLLLEQRLPSAASRARDAAAAIDVTRSAYGKLDNESEVSFTKIVARSLKHRKHRDS